MPQPRLLHWGRLRNSGERRRGAAGEPVRAPRAACRAGRWAGASWHTIPKLAGAGCQQLLRPRMSRWVRGSSARSRRAVRDGMRCRDGAPPPTHPRENEGAGGHLSTQGMEIITSQTHLTAPFAVCGNRGRDLSLLTPKLINKSLKSHRE